MTHFELLRPHSSNGRLVEERSNERVSGPSFAKDPSEQYVVVTSTTNRADHAPRDAREQLLVWIFT